MKDKYIALIGFAILTPLAIALVVVFIGVCRGILQL